jgi:hypothetical protein
MDDTALAIIIAAMSIVPLPLIFRVLHSKTAIWISVLVGLGSAALAVTFFWLWQWSQHPVLAYLDAIVYCSLALLAPLVAINGRLSPSGEQRVPVSQTGLGLKTTPKEQTGN